MGDTNANAQADEAQAHISPINFQNKLKEVFTRIGMNKIIKQDGKQMNSIMADGEEVIFVDPHGESSSKEMKKLARKYEVADQDLFIPLHGMTGSYHLGDVDILLQQTKIEHTNVEEKEALIQSGQKHYSQMISLESKPSDAHMNFFWSTMDLNTGRMSVEVQMLGNALIAKMNPVKPIVLVSLVRAGLPLGVLLKRYIQNAQPCVHYGVSIILGRGIDYAALNLIVAEHGEENIVFVDGWTGKGAITAELTSSLKDYPGLYDQGIPRLVTLMDLGGCSWLSVSAEDWVIPSGILGSVVSGLISRSILEDDIGLELAKSDASNPDNWHKCVYYSHLEKFDISLEFVDRIYDAIENNPVQACAVWGEEDRNKQKALSVSVIEKIAKDFAITNMNRIKPGIAEATRAVMRRLPEKILVKNLTHPSLKLILNLVEGTDVQVIEIGEYLGPYEVVTLIRKKAE